ncbi:MAG TPA: methylamine dehydrogenase accessory protein MauD [Candidatus Binataceae bacterium]|jgi:methylamine dehydrogenase accessory protein MauD|nr:methylamine dehydrogenase accessory protein MauD [Candidatus Binataceae bacterium]
MLETLAISQIVLWIAVLGLAAVVFALIRQIGVLHERIAPMGALTIDRGPATGDQSPVFDLADIRQRPVSIGAPAVDGRSTLLVFVSPDCPVCKKLLPVVKSIARNESSLRVVFASDGDRAEQERFLQAQHIEDYPLVLSPELGMTFRIGKLPYAVLIDEHGTVRAKGLVNTREHLESILTAKELGVASLQEYLKANRLS